MKKITALLIAFALQSNVYGENMHKIHTVIVMLEAKPGKEADFKHALLDVKEASIKEDACIQYSVYQDNNNPALFVLYEKWHSKELHALQFTKPYIIAFGNKVRDWLAKPYQVLMGHEV